MEPVWDPEAVTPGWLQDALVASGAITDQHITSVESAPIGTGQVGCNIRYRIGYDRPGDGPASLVAKFASRSEASRAAGVQTLTYETEVAFYRDLAESVDVSRPHCWLADVEAGTANVLLLMEDIEGAVPGDQIAGCGPDQARLAMVEAAKLHGPRWGDPTLRDVPWLAAKMNNGLVPGPVVGMLWPTFVERYGPSLSEESVEVGTRLAAAQTWAADPGEVPLTVCHTDYRLDNMLFGDPAGPRPLTVVDWQTVQLNSGPADVAYFLSAAMPPAERSKVEPEMVQLYYEHLGRYDIGAYSFDQCWEDYRRHSFSGFFMAVFASVLVGRTDRGDEMFMTMANGAAAQVVALEAFEFLTS